VPGPPTWKAFSAKQRNTGSMRAKSELGCVDHLQPAKRRYLA
jgi:hypothetical protein